MREGFADSRCAKSSPAAHGVLGSRLCGDDVRGALCRGGVQKRAVRLTGSALKRVTPATHAKLRRQTSSGE